MLRQVFGLLAEGPVIVRAFGWFGSVCLACLEARCELEGKRQKLNRMGGFKDG